MKFSKAEFELVLLMGTVKELTAAATNADTEQSVRLINHLIKMCPLDKDYHGAYLDIVFYLFKTRKSVIPQEVFTNFFTQVLDFVVDTTSLLDWVILKKLLECDNFSSIEYGLLNTKLVQWSAGKSFDGHKKIMAVLRVTTDLKLPFPIELFSRMCSLLPQLKGSEDYLWHQGLKVYMDLVVFTENSKPLQKVLDQKFQEFLSKRDLTTIINTHRHNKKLLSDQKHFSDLRYDLRSLINSLGRAIKTLKIDGAHDPI